MVLETTEVFVENSDGTLFCLCGRHQDVEVDLLFVVSAVYMSDPAPHGIVRGQCGANEPV